MRDALGLKLDRPSLTQHFLQTVSSWHSGGNTKSESLAHQLFKWFMSMIMEVMSWKFISLQMDSISLLDPGLIKSIFTRLE